MLAEAVTELNNPPWQCASGDTADLLREALDAVPDNVAVLDTQGQIVMTNIAWRQYAMAYSPLPGRTTPNTGVGVNYLDVASRASRPNDEASMAVHGIRDVLAGKIDAFSLCYPCHAPQEQIWFTMTVTPVLWAGQRAALVVHTDTTPCHHLGRH
jgi:hypothetical protein